MRNPKDLFTNLNEMTVEEFTKAKEMNGWDSYDELTVSKWYKAVNETIQKGEVNQLSEKDVSSIEKARENFDNFQKVIVVGKGGIKRNIYVLDKKEEPKEE